MRTRSSLDPLTKARVLRSCERVVYGREFGSTQNALRSDAAEREYDRTPGLPGQGGPCLSRVAGGAGVVVARARKSRRVSGSEQRAGCRSMRALKTAVA